MTGAARDDVKDALVWLLLVAIGVPIYVYGIASHGINTPDEAYYHGVAEQMVASGDWLHVVFRGAHRPFDAFMNAPLHYWSRAALIEAFGSSYFTMRITAAAFAIASVLVTHRLVRMLGDRPTALLAALVQLTTFALVYLHAGRTGVLEPIVTFLVTLCALLFLVAIESGRGFWLHHACLALLVGVKAPTVLLPLLAELACFACIASTRPHATRWLRQGLAVAPIGLAWHAFAVVAHFDSLPQVFGQMGRHAAGGAGESFVARRATNVAYYARTLFFGAYPYSLVAPVALVEILRRSAGDRPAVRDGWRLLALYVAAIVGFFALIDKRYPWYVIPALPFLCAFVARWLVEIGRREPGGVALGTLALAAGALVAVDVGPFRHNPFDPTFDLLASTGRIAPLVDVRSWLVFGVVAVAVFAAFELSRHRLGPGFARAVAAGATLLLVGFGALRVVAPLDRVGFVSGAEAVRREIDAARAEGAPPPLPRRVPNARASGWIARFYFGEEFRLEQDGADYLVIDEAPADSS